MSEKKQFVYLQLFEDMKHHIENHIWKDGSQIPTEFELMSIYQVSRDTVRKALARLMDQGYIFKQAGKGTFVRRTKSNYQLTLLESFSEQMRRRNSEPSSEIIKIRRGTPTEQVVAQLELKSGEKIFIIERLRRADQEPMCYEIAYVPEAICPDLNIQIQENTSLYDLYENYYQLSLGHGAMTLEAKTAPDRACKFLQIKPKDPVLEMGIVVYLDSGKPLYYVQAYYIGDKYIFSTTLPRRP